MLGVLEGEDMTLAERIELIVYRYKAGMYDEKGATDKILEVFKESLPKACQCCNWEKVREEILKKSVLVQYCSCGHPNYEHGAWKTYADTTGACYKCTCAAYTKTYTVLPSQNSNDRA